MKILQLGKFYPIRGGIEKVMYDLMLGFSEEKVHCDMLCASTERQSAGIFKVNDFATIFVVSTALKVSGTMLAPAMVFKLIKIAKQYDIIHIHHPDPMATLALYFSGFKGTVILHWHSDILKQKMLLKFYQPILEWLIKRADKIVGTTPIYVQQSSFLQQVQDKVDYVPIGVNAMVANQANVLRIKKHYQNKILVFSLGRLVEYKGYEYLIRAAQRLDDHYHILIGGKGPFEKDLTKLIKEYNLNKKITLLGFIDDAELSDYYVACDIFCLSSIWKTEAFAIVQIEAMSCGKPIVSTKIPGSGVSWVNQHDVSGLVVDPQNEDALADAIFQIGSSKLLYQKYAFGSQNRYENYFTREKMIEKCKIIYGEALLL